MQRQRLHRLGFCLDLRDAVDEHERFVGESNARGVCVHMSESLSEGPAVGCQFQNHTFCARLDNAINFRHISGIHLPGTDELVITQCATHDDYFVFAE